MCESVGNQNDAPQPPPDEAEPGREIVRILVVGPDHGVMQTIYDLYHRNFAPVTAWSHLMPSPANPAEVMSVYTRQVRRAIEDS